MNNEKMSLFFSKVYLWMFIGLTLSGAIAYITSINTFMSALYAKCFWGIIIFEIIVVIFMGALIKKVSPLVAKILFLLYSALNGFMLASVFMVYKIDSIVMVFAATALLFFMFASYGFTTKTDLTQFGRLLLIGLVAIIIASIVNIFVFGNVLGVIIAVISIVIFLGLTAYDMQKLKRLYANYANDEVMADKLAIYGALELYLDFINIFIKLLRLFGDRKN